MNNLKNIITKALAEADGFEDTHRHKNLLGNKQKYINAIVLALKREGYCGNL